jgi:NADPH-dependent curcumin reductase
MVRESDFRCIESPIPSPKEGEVLIQNLWISFDPTQRGWMSRDTYVPKIPLGEVMPAFAVGEIEESRRTDYKVGELVLGAFGWQDYVATDGKGLLAMQRVPQGFHRIWR